MIPDASSGPKFQIFMLNNDPASPLSSATSSSSTISPSADIDLTKIIPNKVFYCVALGSQNKHSKTPRCMIFLIPYSLYLHPSRENTFQEDLSQRERENALLSKREALKQCRRVNPDREVFYVKPKRVKGQVVVEGMTLQEFKSLFDNKTPSHIFGSMEFLKNLQKPYQSSPKPAIDYHSGASSSYTRVSSYQPTTIPSKLAIPYSACSLPIDQMHRFSAQFRGFFKLLSTMIRANASEISPYETLRTVFDAIVQTTIEKHPSLTSEEKTALSQLFFHHFESLYWFLEQLLEKIKTGDEKLIRLQCQICLRQMDTLSSQIENVLKDSTQAPTIISEIIETLCRIQTPWKSLVKDLLDNYHLDYCSVFQKELAELFNDRLNENKYLKVKAEITPLGLNALLINRAQLLLRYLQQGIANTKDELVKDTMQEWSILTESLHQSLSNKQWMHTFVIVTQLMTLIETDVLGYQKMNAIIACSSGQVAPGHVKVNMVPWNGATMINDRSFGLMHIKQSNRYLSFAKVLFDSFSHFITCGYASQTINKMGRTLQSAYQQLSISPQEPQVDDEFKPWLSKIKEIAPVEFQQTLKDFQNRLQRLDEIRHLLIDNEKLKNLIQLETHEELKIGLIEPFYELSIELAPLVAEWIDLLQKINHDVESLESHYFWSLSAPELSEFPLEILREKFVRLNERLKSIVKPTANFITAFQESQKMTVFDLSTSSQSQSEISQIPSIFSEVYGKITLSLFQTDLDVFKTIEEQLKSDLTESIAAEALSTPSTASRGEEIFYPFIPSPQPLSESSSSSSSSSSISTTASSVETDFTAAFQSSTKREKVIQELNRLLKTYDIRDDVTITPGKGSHFIFTIAGKRLSFPKAESWRPGLKGKLLRETINQVKEAIARKT